MPWPVVLAAAGIAMQAYSQWKAGQSKEDQEKENAKRAKMAAADALQRGEQKAGLLELAFSRREAAQTAGFAHGGVDTQSGSAARAVAATAMVGKLEAEIIRNNAFREAWGYEMQGGSFTGAAAATSDATTFNLFGSIFSGAGQLAAMSKSNSGSA